MINNILKFLAPIKWHFLTSSIIPILVCFILAKSAGYLAGIIEIVLLLAGTIIINIAIYLRDEHVANKDKKSILTLLLFALLWVTVAVIFMYFIFYSSYNLIWFLFAGYFAFLFNQTKYREFMTFLLFGPLVFLGLFYALSASFSFIVLMFSIAFGLIMMAASTLNILMKTELRYLKRIVKGKRLYYFSLVFPYVIVLLFVIFRHQWPLLIVFFLSIRVYVLVMRVFYNDLSEETLAKTYQLQSFFSILLAVGIIIDFII